MPLFHWVEFIPTCRDLSKHGWVCLNLSTKSPSCKHLLEFSSDVVAVYSIVNVCKYLNNLQYIQTKVRWRFRKILWPPQNIWTLTWQEKEFAIFFYFSFLFNHEITGRSEHYCLELNHEITGISNSEILSSQNLNLTPLSSILGLCLPV